MSLASKVLSTNRVCFFLLFFPLIIDIINGILRGSDGSGESPIGILYRGFIILYSLQYLNWSKYRKLIWLALFWGIICLIVHMMIGGGSTTIISSYIKYIYGYFVLIILLCNDDCRNLNIVLNNAILYAVGAAISLIYCGIFDVGYSSYFEGGFGIKGFFIAMNDVSITMLMLNAFSLYMYERTNDFKYFIYSLIISIGASLVGSIACYAGTVIIYAAYTVSIFLIRFKDFQPTSRQRIIILILIYIVVAYFVTIIITIINEDSYLSRKYDDLLSVFLEHSGRAYLVDAGKEYLNNQSFIKWIFGSGDLFYYGLAQNLGMSDMKGVESDFWDLLGTFGILMTILLFWYPVKILFYSIHSFFKERLLLYYWITIISSIFLGNSFYSGHALTSPLTMSYFILVFYLVENNKEIIDDEIA